MFDVIYQNRLENALEEYADDEDFFEDNDDFDANDLEDDED